MISLHHRNGLMLARYPHMEWNANHPLKNKPKFDELLSKADHGTIRINNSLTGREQLSSIRLLSHFPVSVVVSKPISVVLADWEEQTRLLIGVAAIFTILIGLILSLIVRQISHHHRFSRQQLMLEKKRLATAVNNMTQGLMLFDTSGRLVICNQQYIDMYGLSVDVVKPGCHLRDLIAHRKATGSLKADVDTYCAAIIENASRNTNTVVETADGRSILICDRPVADGGWLTTHEDITERRRTEERIAHLAHYDALTDLPNRVLFHEQLETKLRTVSSEQQTSVLYIDIDEFKSVNDSLGHQVGDELLKAMAGRLRGCVRDIDIVARLGGDEFAIIADSIEKQEDVVELVARIYEAIRAPFDCLGHRISTDASIGVAISPQDGRDIDQLLKNADLAMYSAKEGGRRTHRFFEREMEARMKSRHTIELDLRRTVESGNYEGSGFEIHYQPLVNLADGRISGCEALLRWNHPLRGSISPAEFIQVAEETGLIDHLGEWVLETACKEAVNWPASIKIAVNVSPVQLKRGTLPLKVATVMAASGLSSRRLELEITEAVLIRDDAAALAILHQLRSLGARIALDDFGTGYSSLSYLQRFPFDKIKIDRCFINDVIETGGSSSIVQAVVNIAAARNMTTTAEGVETEQQRAALKALGCTEMQGFLFSPARPASDIRHMLADSRQPTGTETNTAA